MDIIRKGDGIVEIDAKVRIEPGPVRRQEIATEALLSDAVTAAHYQVGKPDALGKIIALGESMDFIDWRSAERAYYVYAFEEVTDIVNDEPITNTRWLLKGHRADETAALSFATTLAAAT